MIAGRKRGASRFYRVFAAALTASALVLAGCSNSASGEVETATGATGEPQPGGTLKAVQISEPRSLDPAAMSNSWSTQGFLGNALFGTLLINDPVTGEIEGQMAEGFSSDDSGATFTLELLPDLTFTDGTPLDAAAVKVNWDRLKDPSTGSSTLAQAGAVESAEVVDEQTLRVSLRAPNPNFGEAVVNSSMNWIASPAALAKGAEWFNENPVGAGPFTLESWARQDVIELVKNPDYWDAPRPYVDRISLRSSNDTNQRLNTLTTGGADVIMETNWETIAKATSAGHPTDIVPMGGGQYIALNTRRAPFDDIRARQAVLMAVNLESMNLAVYNGEGQIPETLFPESSPFYADTPMSRHDPEAAQQLFDELAAEGKPVEFTYTSFSTVENRAGAESLQAQLSAFENVEAKVNVVDFPTGMATMSAKDFQAMVSSANVQDPDYGLWTSFHSSSNGNASGISDEQLDQALEAGRYGETFEERKAAYDAVQNRLLELAPGIFYTRAAPAVATGQNVGGVRQYGYGSLLPAELWLQN